MMWPKRTGAYLQLAALVVAGAVVALAGFSMSYAGPAEIVRGVANEIAVQPVKGGTDYTIRLADGREYVWSCGSRSCRRTGETLASREIQWAMPAPAVITIHGNRVTGLELGGSRLIIPEAEIARRQGDMLGLLLGGGVALGVAILIGALNQRHRPRKRRATMRKANA